MRLQTEILTSSASGSLNEQALAGCRASVEAEERGDYLAAVAALNPFWAGVGEEPRLEGLNRFSQAMILLRVGVLTSRVGTNKGLKKTQEIAKNYLSLSRSYFEQAGFRDGIAEAQMYLAACYFMLGEIAEARIVLTDALTYVSDSGYEIRVKARIWLAIVEYGSRRFGDALNVLQQTQPYLVHISSDYLLGSFHGEYGKALEAVGAAESNSEYTDRALIELTAASVHLERAGHERNLARNENNHGLLLLGLKQWREALSHFDKSRHIFDRLKDASIVARIDVNRARAYLELEQYFDALKIIKRAIDVLELGDEAARFTEALTLHGVILARVGNTTQAHGVLMQAVLRANEAGNQESAGLAYLALLEEISELGDNEASDAYQEACTLLDKVQDVSVTRRLLSVSKRLVGEMGKKTSQSVSIKTEADEFTETQEFTEGFSLTRETREYVRGWIVKAMNATGGNVLRASKLLGFPKPQRLYQLLREHRLGHLQTRRHQQPIIEQASKVSDLHSYVEFTLPLGVRESDVCAMHQISTDVLLSKGVRPGDFALIKVCEVEEGDLVGVDVHGRPYQIGLLKYEGDYLHLSKPNSTDPPRILSKRRVGIEGRVVGYLKAEDVRCYKKGKPVKSYNI